jgi:NADPH:quinone reductase-like Zn-dependent oxidoreductase
MARRQIRSPGRGLEHLLELLELGVVWPPEITRYKLTDAPEAHRVSAVRHLRGKLVFEVR